MTIYTDLTLQPIYQGQEYTSPDGTQYPSNFPLDTISELNLVTETTQPTSDTLVVTGFIIDETYTQIWQTRVKTEEEIATEKQLAYTNFKSKISKLLLDCDWRMLPDVTLTTEQVNAWKVYRSELRAVLHTYADNPEDAIFPTVPFQE